MPQLASPNDALVSAAIMLKNQPVVQLQQSILQDASSMLWLAAPWRWSLDVVTPFVAVGGSQDFVFTLPADWLRFERGWLQDSSKAQELQPCATQPVSTLPSQPVYFSYLRSGSSDLIRLNGVLPPVGSGQTGNASFYAVYKKVAPDLTNTFNTPGALQMDDSYFWVYRQLVLYFAYLYGDDTRAGSATTVMSPDGKVQVQYSGQLGVAHAAIEFMRITENVSAIYPFLGNQPLTKAT